MLGMLGPILSDADGTMLLSTSFIFVETTGSKRCSLDLGHVDGRLTGYTIASIGSSFSLFSIFIAMNFENIQIYPDIMISYQVGHTMLNIYIYIYIYTLYD